MQTDRALARFSEPKLPEATFCSSRMFSSKRGTTVSTSEGTRINNNSDAHEIKLTLVNSSKRPVTRLSSEEIQTLIGVQIDWSTVSEFVEILSDGKPAGVHEASVNSTIPGEHSVSTRLWGATDKTLSFQ